MGPLLTAVMVGLLLCAGCVSTEHAADTGAIEWGVCAQGVGTGPSAARVECGTLAVPLDPAKPQGRTITLAVARLRASERSDSTVVVNPGGPGASGVDYLLGAADRLAAQRFTTHSDVVTFDPRGVGASAPTVRCRTATELDAEREADSGDRSPQGIAAAEATNRGIARKCSTRTGDEFLGLVGTSQVVDDVDRLRAALGRSRIDFIGFSYGSKIALEYEQRYPDRLFRMVIDGAVDPAANPVDTSVAQARSFQEVFDAFARDCTRMPGCALGADPAGALVQYQRLVRPLSQRPVPAGAGRTLDFQSAVDGTSMALYRTDLWPTLRSGLADLAAGRGGETLMSLADLLEGRGPGGTYDNSADAYLAIGCADGPRITDRAANDDLDRRLRAAAPYSDDGRGTGPAPLDPCAFWPPESVATARLEPGAASSAPTPTPLIVAVTHDPATPYAVGEEIARRTHGTLITVDGYGHTAALQGNRCVDEAVGDYLLNLDGLNGPLAC
ncbi:alpha/beta hydrolase [Gordonia jacobaea]|uniref:alpha/beta hydrolase n=1 Tax=Gordonia jacobaea TaxID=122202 RepID=UPI0022DFD4FC|nr:alpha/beta hydrolase [Gordonia jacobaea]